MPSILFVCTANIFRSSLSEAFFRQKLLKAGESVGWVVKSAGVWTTSGQSLPPELIKAAAEWGLDLNGHRTQAVNKVNLDRFNLIVVMEKGQQESLGVEFPAIRRKLCLLSRAVDRRFYDIPDPAASHMAMASAVAQMADLIERSYPTLHYLAQKMEMNEKAG